MKTKKSLAYKLGFDSAGQPNRGYINNYFVMGTQEAKDFELGVEARKRKEEKLKP